VEEVTYEQLRQQVADAGIVGAGGAGFPTHVKLAKNMDYLIVNGAECEPLLYTDQILMNDNASLLIDTLHELLNIMHIRKGILGIKKKHTTLIEKLRQAASTYPNIIIQPLTNAYPTGDEITLIYECTNLVIPKGSLPSTKKVLVCNVETLLNIGKKIFYNEAVTTTYLTLGGAVVTPLYLEVPIGMTIGDLLQEVKVALPYEGHILVGGPMMGRFVDLAYRITKTTKGILLLPKNHEVYRLSQRAQLPSIKRVMSACSQCRMCTDLCPRNRLGHKVEPHKLMNAFANGALNHTVDMLTALGCCGCKLCSNYACHHELNPGELMMMVRRELLAKGVKGVQEEPVPNRLIDIQVPASRLTQRLGLATYDKHPVVYDVPIVPEKVDIPLLQHIGKPAIPLVTIGDNVTRGQLLAHADTNALSANVHASLDGVVTQITKDSIMIERRSN
jgi:Na+-translocating ferredoxin:NAD+ oxidoreductase RnfC subunit